MADEQTQEVSSEDDELAERLAGELEYINKPKRILDIIKIVRAVNDADRS